MMIINETLHCNVFYTCLLSALCCADYAYAIKEASVVDHIIIYIMLGDNGCNTL